MQERPILFSGPMVRALVAGKKTQTRRVVKPLPQMVKEKKIQQWEGDASALLNLLTKSGKTCPYGQPGDRLWVRESWAKTHVMQASGDEWIVYRDGDNRTDYGGPWKPSIHMPRCASRILLEVTGVRVESLQNISEADAEREGCAPSWLDADDNETVHAGVQPTYRQGFARVWRDINSPDSWALNPWVWVVEFKQIAKGGAA